MRENRASRERPSRGFVFFVLRRLRRLRVAFLENVFGKVVEEKRRRRAPVGARAPRRRLGVRVEPSADGAPRARFFLFPALRVGCVTGFILVVRRRDMRRRHRQVADGGQHSAHPRLGVGGVRRGAVFVARRSRVQLKVAHAGARGVEVRLAQLLARELPQTRGDVRLGSLGVSHGKRGWLHPRIRPAAFALALGAGNLRVRRAVATHARRLSPRKSFAQRARSRAAQWRARVSSGAFPCCSTLTLFQVSPNLRTADPPPPPSPRRKPSLPEDVRSFASAGPHYTHAGARGCSRAHGAALSTRRARLEHRASGSGWARKIDARMARAGTKSASSLRRRPSTTTISSPTRMTSRSSTRTGRTARSSATGSPCALSPRRTRARSAAGSASRRRTRPPSSSAAGRGKPETGKAPRRKNEATTTTPRRGLRWRFR